MPCKMATRFSLPSALMGPDDDCCLSDTEAQHPNAAAAISPASTTSTAVAAASPLARGSGGFSPEERSSLSENENENDDLEQSAQKFLEDTAASSETEDTEASGGWGCSPLSPPLSSAPEDAAAETATGHGAAAAAADASASGDRVKPQRQRPSWAGRTKQAASSAAAAARATAASATQRLMKVQAFICRLLAGSSRRLPDDRDPLKPDTPQPTDKAHVSMAFHERGHASELLQYHFMSGSHALDRELPVASC